MKTKETDGSFRDVKIVSIWRAVEGKHQERSHRINHVPPIHEQQEDNTVELKLSELVGTGRDSGMRKFG